MTNTDVRSLTINSTDHIFAGTYLGGVFRSTDNGDSWTEINNGLTSAYVFSFAINSSDHIFAGTSGDGVFRSTDNGDTWTEINNGLTNLVVNSLAINSSDHILAGTYGGAFRSTDNGDNWMQINNDLTNPLVYSLAINSTGHIFAGTNGGAFRSTDNGDNWTEVNTGLTNLVVYSLAINSTGHIFAGTLGSGVFRSLQSTTSVREVTSELPSSFSLAQNYPNPFNPMTVIEYTLPVRSEVNLIIYSILGEKVTRLADEVQPAGYHKVTWNAVNMASGIYFYRLQAGDFVQTRKMVLLK